MTKKVADALLIFISLAILAGMAAVGIIKVLAWWRVAFGDCS